MVGTPPVASLLQIKEGRVFDCCVFNSLSRLFPPSSSMSCPTTFTPCNNAVAIHVPAIHDTETFRHLLELTFQSLFQAFPMIILSVLNQLPQVFRKEDWNGKLEDALGAEKLSLRTCYCLSPALACGPYVTICSTSTVTVEYSIVYEDDADAVPEIVRVSRSITDRSCPRLSSLQSPEGE